MAKILLLDCDLSWHSEIGPSVVNINTSIGEFGRQSLHGPVFRKSEIAPVLSSVLVDTLKDCTYIIWLELQA